MKWITDVGHTYKIQCRGDLLSGSWLDATPEMSATKTNMATLFNTSGANVQFFRAVRVR